MENHQKIIFGWLILKMIIMNKFKTVFNIQISKSELYFILILIFYIILGVILLEQFQYQINDDGIMLISIAQKYFNGDFINAINGYWGPLFSWILLPFLFFGAEPIIYILSSKVLLLGIGLIMLLGLRKLSYHLAIDEKIRALLLFASSIALIGFSLIVTTSDLLFSCILIYYLSIIFDTNYINKIHYGLFCGFLGALAYLSKAYGFPFFICHFTVFNLIFYLKYKNYRKKIFKNFLIGITIFCIISGVWVGIISEKYDYVTIGTSGGYNQALVGPLSQGHPMHYLGFIEPPNDSSISSWEDPSYFEVQKWNSFSSWDNFKHQIDIISFNIMAVFFITQSFSILSILIIIGALAIIIKKYLIKRSFDSLFYFMLSLFIYSSGYVFVLIEERYLWLNYFILLLMGGYLLTKLFSSSLVNSNKIKNFLLVIFVFSFIVNPIITLSTGIDYVNSEKELYILTNELKEDGVQGNIASIGGYYSSLYISYYLKSKYYGESPANIRYYNLEKDLKDNNIDYLFVWDNLEHDDTFLAKYKIVKEVKMSGSQILTIYFLKNPP